MVFNCVVYQCFNRQNKCTKDRKLRFFRFPKNKRKRTAWVKAINRKDWQPNEYSRICSDHFVDNWHSDDPSDVNFAPTIFNYKLCKPSDVEKRRHEFLFDSCIQTGMKKRLLHQTKPSCFLNMFMKKYAHLLYE